MMKWLYAGLAFALVSPANAAEERSDGEPKICKKQIVTGSRVRAKRICLTLAEWDKMANNAMDDLNDARRPINTEREGA